MFSPVLKRSFQTTRFVVKCFSHVFVPTGFQNALRSNAFFQTYCLTHFRSNVLSDNRFRSKCFSRIFVKICSHDAFRSRTFYFLTFRNGFSNLCSHVLPIGMFFPTTRFVQKCVSRVFLKICFQNAFRSKTCSRLFFVRGVGGSGRRPVSPPTPKGVRRGGK